MKKNMSFWSRLCVIIFLVPAVMLLMACGGGGSGSGSGETGTLSLSITDSPVDDAEKVVVAFTGVELKHQDGDRKEFYFCEVDDNDEFEGNNEFKVQGQPCTGEEYERKIDLLALHSGLSEELLGEEEVKAGRYNWIRLKVNAERGEKDSYIQFDADGKETESLRIPSGAQTGLKLVQGFVVPAGGHADFTIDFDLRKSVIDPQGHDDYFLKPTLRLVDNAEVGIIAGEVDSELIDPDGGNAVYVFEGHNAELHDIQGEETDPLTTATVSENNINGETVYKYRAAFLPPGDYTVAFTDQADEDNPEDDDDIDFHSSNNVVVDAGEVTVQNFE
ncbi:DUF4382 domain-containing protein [Desulfonatronospira sp.]|uniref:DUF4382 domain-containing protein n=1 Tax=Desulfonatronospira sp. TaxID=1962951 RepID=UPI0025B8F063|nr:DUF4382 domain-containing protein [Desulfonatronospira sp.]